MHVENESQQVAEAEVTEEVLSQVTGGNTLAGGILIGGGIISGGFAGAALGNPAHKDRNIAIGVLSGAVLGGAGAAAIPVVRGLVRRPDAQSLTHEVELGSPQGSGPDAT
jgi:hypothetical protein